jgi:hypothetical protein
MENGTRVKIKKSGRTGIVIATDPNEMSFVFIKMDDGGEDEYKYAGDLDDLTRQKAPKKIKVATIDCAPTWQGILPWYLSALTDDKTKIEGRKIARDELAKMAKAADACNDLSKEFTEFADRTIESISVMLMLIDNPIKAADPANQRILNEIRQLVKEYKDERKKEEPEAYRD